MARAVPLVGLVCLGLFLSGCSGPGAALFGADAVTQLASGRTIQGNLIYAVTGRDCVPLNLLSGRPVCKDEDEQEASVAEASPVYCYRTLGQVDCHTEPDPQMPATTRLYRD